MSLFVTCLYNLADIEKNVNRKPISFYLKYTQFLKNLKQDLVVFTTPEMTEKLTQVFQEVQNIHIISHPWEKLSYFDRIEEVKLNSGIHPYQTRSPHKDTELFKILIWNKPEFIKIASQQFLQYDTFIWIDFGLEFVVEKYIHKTNIPDIISKFDDAHFFCTVLNPLSQHEYDNLDISYEGWRFRTVGGFWALGRKCVDFFTQFIQKEIEILFREKYTCLEEDLFARFVFVNGDRCKLSFGDYDTCMINWSGLRQQVQFIPSVLQKFQNNGQHTLAIQGYEALLDSFMNRYLPYHIGDLFELMYCYYISLYYIDQTKAKEIAIQILRIASIEPYVQEIIVSKKSHFYSNFRYTLSEDEINVLFSSNHTTLPFFNCVYSNMLNRTHQSAPIFRNVDLDKIRVIDST